MIIMKWYCKSLFLIQITYCELAWSLGCYTGAQVQPGISQHSKNVVNELSQIVTSCPFTQPSSQILHIISYHRKLSARFASPFLLRKLK